MKGEYEECDFPFKMATPCRLILNHQKDFIDIKSGDEFFFVLSKQQRDED